jgi:phage terminase large subunit GpA-like protein
VVFTESEKRAWFPPERLTPSEWTEKHRTLPATVAAEAGALRLARTPYIAGILDAIKEPGVEEIVCLKSTQIAWSTAIESLIGYFVDSDPGPILLVLDSEKTAKEVMEERLRPLIENTPAVSRHLSSYGHDQTLVSVKFDSCPLYMGWAGSPGTLARRAIRYLLCDEVDKYPSNAGREADPVSLASERTQTYGYRRKILLGSTPTVRTGTIWRAWEAAGDKRRYHVPCPHCGEYQFLVFGQIKYPALSISDKNLYADAIEQQALAHYECSACRTPIKEAQRPRMLAKGVWLSEGQSIDREGKIAGKRPRAKRVGFWINSLYSPWRSFSAIAAEHRRSLNDPGRLQNFRNSWLAEVWEEVVKSASVEDYRRLLDGAPKAGIVPSWASYLIASADVQKDRFYWIVRAWGAGYRSQLISHGLAFTFDELRRLALDSQFALATGQTARPQALFIDAGYRTDEVYQFAQSDDRIKPVKGANDAQSMLVKYSPEAQKWGIALFMLNTQLLKDRLSVLRNETGRWMLNDKVDDEYLQHLASEHKTLVKGQEKWDTKSVGAANHYLDCEVYQIAGAEISRVDLLQSEAPSAPPTTMPPTVDRPRVGAWLGNTNGWL